MSVPKLERLMNLVAALLHTSAPVSAEVLRTRVEGYDSTASAFRRQFERDKEDLREMGVPIRVEPIPGSNPPLDGYRIDRSEYYLPDPGLSADELAALHLATRMVPVAGPRSPSVLWKLGGVLSDGRDSATTPLATIPADPNLGALYDAAIERRVVGFSHRQVERRLEPWVVGFQGGHWYVSGFDLDRDDERLYRLDRIDGHVRRLGAAEHPRPDRHAGMARLAPWTVGALGSMTARVRADAMAAASLVGEVGEDRVVEADDDGAVVVEFEVTNPEGFRSWLLGLGEHVVVESPDVLRQLVVDWLLAWAVEEG